MTNFCDDSCEEAEEGEIKEEEENNAVPENAESCSASLLLTIELPALNLQTNLCCTLKPGRQDQVWDSVEELVHSIHLDSMDTGDFESAGKACWTEKFDQLRKQAGSDFEEWQAKVRLADDMKRKVDSAGERMNKMRTAYYKELLHLREQVYRRQESDEKGDAAWRPTYLAHFDPTEYHMDDEVTQLVNAKLKFIQQEYEFKTKELELRLESMKESFEGAQTMLDKYRKQVAKSNGEERASKTNNGVHVSCLFNDDPTAVELLGLQAIAPSSTYTKNSADEVAESAQKDQPQFNALPEPSKRSHQNNASQRWGKVRAAVRGGTKNQKRQSKLIGALGKSEQNVSPIRQLREVGTDPMPYAQAFRKVALATQACQTDLDAPLLAKAMTCLDEMDLHKREKPMMEKDLPCDRSASNFSNKNDVGEPPKSSDDAPQASTSCPELQATQQPVQKSKSTKERCLEDLGEEGRSARDGRRGRPLRQCLPRESDPVDEQVLRLGEIAGDINKTLPLMMLQAQKLRESGCESAHKLVVQIAKLMSAGEDQPSTTAPTGQKFSTRRSSTVEQIVQRHGIPVEEQVRPESAFGINSTCGLTGESLKSRRAWTSISSSHQNSVTSDKLGHLVADISPALAARSRHRSAADKFENGEVTCPKLDARPDLSAGISPCVSPSPTTFSAIWPYDKQSARLEPTVRTDATRTPSTLTSTLDAVDSTDSEEEGQEADIASETSYASKFVTEPLDLRSGVANLLCRTVNPKVKHRLSSCSAADNGEETPQPKCPGKLPGLAKRRHLSIDLPASVGKVSQASQHVLVCEDADETPTRRLRANSIRSSTPGIQVRRSSCPSVCDTHADQTSTFAVLGQGQSPPGTPRSVQKPVSPASGQARPVSLRLNKYRSS